MWSKDEERASRECAIAAVRALLEGLEKGVVFEFKVSWAGIPTVPEVSVCPTRNGRVLLLSDAELEELKKST